MVYIFFYKTSSRGVVTGIPSDTLPNKDKSFIKNEVIPNQDPPDLVKQQLAEELHKIIITKIEKRKVFSSFVTLLKHFKTFLMSLDASQCP